MRLELAIIRSSLLQLKLHCPAVTSEDARKSDLLAELTDFMSDGAAQDLWILSVGIDSNPSGPYQSLIPTFYKIKNKIKNKLKFRLHMISHPPPPFVFF